MASTAPRVMTLTGPSGGPDERRVAQRDRVLRGGYVVFNGGRTTISCTVRDISATGAKIDVASATSIPTRFELDLPGALRFSCSVVWQSKSALGIRFLDKGPSITIPPRQAAWFQAN